MAQLTLHLLGAPRIELDGVPLVVDRRKAIALLIYLAIEGGQQPREHLLVGAGQDASHERSLEEQEDDQRHPEAVAVLAHLAQLG